MNSKQNKQTFQHTTSSPFHRFANKISQTLQYILDTTGQVLPVREFLFIIVCRNESYCTWTLTEQQIVIIKGNNHRRYEDLLYRRRNSLIMTMM